MSDDIKPVDPPSLDLPESDNVVEVSIINTGCDMVVPASGFVQPVIKGQEYLNLPTFCFLIKNKKLGKTILFDQAPRKDWWNFSPHTVKTIHAVIPGFRAPKNINEVLKEGGEDDSKVESLIWSHWHWDHTGDASLFPKSAEIVVGPGFKKDFMPGYPTNPDSPMLDSDYEGREVREIEFDENFKIGGFHAYDFFGDGSFYILDVPGHAQGHISGLARTTKDTFVFMGGDICHYGGTFRPNQFAPMPKEIPDGVPLDERLPRPCPCSLFTACHPNKENPRASPYYTVTQSKGGWYSFPQIAQDSVNKLVGFEGNPNVFVCIAHDQGLLPVVDWFPTGTINDWKAKGWKTNSQWGFVNELPVDEKPGRPPMCPGLVRDGEVVQEIDFSKL